MIKNYLQYIKESITTDVDGLIDSMKDKKVDFYDLNLSSDNYADKTIDVVYDDATFNEQLYKENLKKGELDSTMEIENFLRKDIDMKFFFLYSRNKTMLDNPKFILLQYYKDDKWYPIEIYKISDDINKFYDKLTAKTIKLTFDNVTYIYTTSNSGNNWILKDSNKKTDKFKENIETEDIKNIIKDGAKLNIID